MARTPIFSACAAVILIMLLAARAPAAAVDGGLFFAGLDGGFPIQGSHTGAEPLESELVGIIVDGQEVGTELVYRLGEAYYLPAALLSTIGVQGAVRAGRFYLNTPGGEVETGAHYFRDLYGGVFFMAELLDEVLKIHWEFSAEKYAVSMTLPWWRSTAPGGGTVNGTGPDIDFNPSAFGMTQVRLDHTRFVDAQNAYGYSNLLLRGRLAQGVWRSEFVREENRRVRAENYYWLKDFDHAQALAGHQEVLINPLLPAIETTGAQTLYSSNPIEFDPYQDQTRSQYVRRFGIASRDIEGTAQPGAIAELRVNERPVARVRVNLDGTYRFDRIRSNSLQFQTLKVHILDQRSFVELDIQDFTRTPIDLLLEKGQLVGFAGAGVNGNPLDPSLRSQGAAAFGLMRYGVTDQLTLEAGVQKTAGRLHQVAGLSASFGRRWALTASAGHHGGGYGYSTDFYGRGERWILNLRAQRYGEGFRSDLSGASSFNELRYEYWLTGRFSLGLNGRSEAGAGGGNDTLLPGFSWRFNRRNILRVWPDFNGAYRMDLRTAHRQRDWFEFVHDAAGDRAEYRYFKGPQLEFFGRVQDHARVDRTSAELGAIWYPRAYDDRSQLAGSLLGTDGGMGYRLTWETTVLPGLFSNLELRHEPVATEYTDRGLQVRWTLSVDLAIAGGRPVPARNDFVQSRAGSIGGRIMVADGEAVHSEDIKQVAIRIDGRTHTAVLSGRYFFVRNLPPGIYEVSLGSEYLPMSLSPERVTHRVRVVPAATTTVDFVVNREYGLGGRVTARAGAGADGVRVEVLDGSGAVIADTRTDAYGYYQLSGLRPGRYRVRAAADKRTAPDEYAAEPAGGSEREVTITSDFVFDADLSLPGPGAGSPVIRR